VSGKVDAFEGRIAALEGGGLSALFQEGVPNDSKTNEIVERVSVKLAETFGLTKSKAQTKKESKKAMF
jgi:hypothetical protein